MFVVHQVVAHYGVSTDMLQQLSYTPRRCSNERRSHNLPTGKHIVEDDSTIIEVSDGSRCNCIYIVAECGTTRHLLDTDAIDHSYPPITS